MAVDPPSDFIEREQKFLLTQPSAEERQRLSDTLCEKADECYRIRQGYIDPAEIEKFRLRLVEKIDKKSGKVIGAPKAVLTLKGPSGYVDGVKERAEIDLNLSVKDSQQMQAAFPHLCPYYISKDRHVVRDTEADRKWEIDLYSWQPPAHALFADNADIARKYQDLITIDVELKDKKHKVTCPDEFPEWLQSFLPQELIEPKKKERKAGAEAQYITVMPEDITQDKAYKSKRLGLVNAGEKPDIDLEPRKPDFLRAIIEGEVGKNTGMERG